jgi:hypothetical protein
VSLSLGYVVVPSFRRSSAPELLDAHSGGITRQNKRGPNLPKGRWLAPVWVLDRPGGHHPPCASTAVSSYTPALSDAVDTWTKQG